MTQDSHITEHIPERVPPVEESARIETIMTREVVTIGMDEPLYVIQRTLQREGFHHLLVVEEDELIGLISDRDLLSAISPFVNTPSEQRRDERTLHKRAHHIMSRQIISVTRQTPVSEAAALLLEHNIGCLPVVSTSIAPLETSSDSHLQLVIAGRTIEGIVTWRDILGYYLGRRRLPDEAV